MLLVPEDDFDATITATEAGEEFLVSESTIRSWVRKGTLKVAGIDHRNGRAVPVYRRGDVAFAERAARRRDPVVQRLMAMSA